MKEKLESELKNIARKIVESTNLKDIDALQNEARAIYEHLTFLKLVRSYNGEMQTISSKSDVQKMSEEETANVITENTKVSEAIPPPEDPVATIPTEETLEAILADVNPGPAFIKKEESTTASLTTVKEKNTDPKKLSLNDVLKKEIQIGLNDRIGFVKHLFNGNNNAFDSAVSQLDAMKTAAEATHFITHTIKPGYNNWQGKEEYEARFSELIEAKFEA